MDETEILLIEDEPHISEVVCLYLRRASYTVQTIANGRSALAYLEKQFPALVILDIMLPDMDGYAILRWLRDRSDVPVIMLTARRDEVDRIAGLELGADDYVIKPFSPQELVSRVRAILRRSRSCESESDGQLQFSDMLIDPKTRLVTREINEIILTNREFDLLWLLASHPRQVFSREHLLDRVWGGADYIDPGTVTVHLRRLREKIEPDASSPRHLITVWGVGYKFEP